MFGVYFGGRGSATAQESRPKSKLGIYKKGARFNNVFGFKGASKILKEPKP